MEFKIPFYLTLLFAGAIETVVFVFLYFRERQKFLYLWANGWILFTLRAVMELVNLYFPWVGFVFIGRLCLLAGACYLLKGTFTYVEVKLKKYWLFLFGILFIYSVMVVVSNFQYVPMILPVYLFNGGVFILLGVMFLKSQRVIITGKNLIALVLIIWGVTEIAAGIKPLSIGLSPWIALISGFYSILIAVFIIISYFARVSKMHAESETRYRTLFNENRAPMLIIDPDTMRILDMNKAALDFYGYSGEALENLTIYDIAVAEKEFIRQNIKKVLSSGTQRSELVNRTADGEEREVEVFNGTIVLDGKTVLTSIVNDIGDRKKQEREREMIREELEKANELKQEFMANISHELRTPLNGILGMASLLQETHLTDEQVNYLDMIHISGEGLYRVISDILNFSDIISKDFELEISEFELRELLTWILNRFRAEAEAKDLELKFQFYPGVAKKVVTDKLRLSQICVNLISNAIKFTDTGWVEVAVRPEGGDTVITVSDTGVGIEEKNLKGIFDLFTLGVSTYTKRYAGAGIGLAIVKELVDKLEGTISVDSMHGEGSVFTVRLPLEASAKEPEVTTRIYEHVEGRQLRQNLKVLVAEDEVINRMYIEEFLRLRGAEVVSVRTGEDVLQKVSSESFDVILMDISMPKMNGLEAAQKIRLNEKSRTPIIALTAYTYPEDIRSCMDAGMDDFLPKPVDEIRLVEMLNKYSA